MPKRPATSHVVARIKNTRSTPMAFVLEPWGEVYGMPPASTFEVISENIPNGAIEVTTDETQVTVYGWPGSELRVRFDAGEPVVITDAKRLTAFLKGTIRLRKTATRVRKATRSPTMPA